jgi:hypothetical protein
MRWYVSQISSDISNHEDILGGPITVEIAEGVPWAHGVSYFMYGNEMDAAINCNLGYIEK